MGGAVPDQDESRNWLYDHLVAILRTAADRNNDFGYSTLIARFRAAIGSEDLDELFTRVIAGLEPREARDAERWVRRTLPTVAEPGRRGFQDWLAGKKALTPAIVAAFTFGLSDLLKELEQPRQIDVNNTVNAHAYSLWNKLLTHQDFEPLPELVQTACGDLVQRVSAPTLMADLADRAVQDAGRIPVFAFDGGLIYWQSATDAGKDHKRKELSARARALRYSRSEAGFALRPGVDRLLLVIDGTFSSTDLRILTDSGWDEIYYPDEMERLAGSIRARRAG